VNGLSGAVVTVVGWGIGEDERIGGWMMQEWESGRVQG